MSASLEHGTSTARSVADLLGPLTQGPWEVFGQHLVHHEVHLTGREIELVRGPVEVEGFSVRVFRRHDSVLGVGQASSNRADVEGVRAALDRAERWAPLSSFPTPKFDVAPGGAAPPGHGPVDPAVRDRPLESIHAFVAELLAAHPERSDVQPSFGSVRVTYGTTSVVNSAGLERSHDASYVELEWAVKSSGGPEGPAPGEYWVNSTAARLGASALGVDVPRWSRLARDVRTARPPAGGPNTVLFPASVLHDIIPPIVGFRLSAAAALRKIAPGSGEAIAAPGTTITDEPGLPWGPAGGPFDDEGRPTSSRVILEDGNVRGLYSDGLHAAALGSGEPGNAWRAGGVYSTWFRFVAGAQPSPSNLVIRPGDGGKEADLLESVGEGLWLEQLGYAFPDPISGAYGGEIRIGYRVHRGKLAEPVRGGTVGSLLFGPKDTPTLLGAIRHIGSEPTLVGAFSSPTLAVADMPVAGP